MERQADFDEAVRVLARAIEDGLNIAVETMGVSCFNQRGQAMKMSTWEDKATLSWTGFQLQIERRDTFIYQSSEEENEELEKDGCSPIYEYNESLTIRNMYGKYVIVSITGWI